MILKLRLQTYSIQFAATISIMKPGTQPHCYSDCISFYHSIYSKKQVTKEWIIAIIAKAILTAWDKWTYRIGLQDVTIDLKKSTNLGLKDRILGIQFSASTRTISSSTSVLNC